MIGLCANCEKKNSTDHKCNECGRAMCADCVMKCGLHNNNNNDRIMCKL
jgi:hypothetical protein